MPSENGTNGDNVRLVRVTAGNLRQKHLYVKGHYDFFPADCVGGPRRATAADRSFEVRLDGLGERRPPLVLLENVVGFLMSRGGRDLEHIHACSA